MKRGLGYRYLLPGAFGIGVLVTLLESVCIGQVYVPTLTMLAGRNGAGRELGLLLLYNGRFILPLLAVFVIAWRGLNTRQFIELSKKNVVYAKFVMAGFFLLLAGLMSVLPLN